MKTITKIVSSRAVFCALALTLTPGISHAVLALVDYNLSGTQDTVYWESPDLNNINATLTPTSGSGTIAPISPGYQAGAGFYSFMGDFGATVNASTGYDVQNVVFQLVMMANPDFSAQDSLNYDGNYLPDFDPAGGYTGGPILYINGSTTDGIQATLASVVAGPSYETIGGFSGDISSYAWEWNLSGIGDTVNSISIVAPIIIHQATVEARLDTSSIYSQAIPEPATTAVIGGLLAVCVSILGKRFRRRS